MIRHKRDITCWATIISFLVFCLFPTQLWAQDPPSSSIGSSVNLFSCEPLGTPKLDLTLPSIGSTGKIYDVGSSSSQYRLWDITTNSAVDVQGTLFDRIAAASLLVGLRSVEELWQIELERVLSYNNACWQYRLALKEAEVRSRDAKIVAVNEEMIGRLRIKDEQIDFLSENYNPPSWYEAGEFWFGTGLIVGLAVTIGAGYALGLASGQ